MTLEKTVIIDKIEVLESGHVQVRQATRIMENGIEIGKTYHRYVISPGDSYINEDDKIKVICGVVHTPECVAAYKKGIAKIAS